jgi:uncharacterized protein (TIGR02611 family)
VAAERTECRRHGRLMERVRERKAAHKQRHIVYRASFATAGIAVILLGLVLIPLPGPGWLIVAIGVGMLALEFDRAERVLEALLDRLERVTEQATEASRGQKLAALVALGALGGALLAAVLLLEIPYLPG